MLTNRKTQRKLDKASTTTRNTTRVRAPKGFADDLRYRALKSVPHERLESLLQKRLQAMSGVQRSEVEADLRHLSEDDRHEVVLRLLSRSSGGGSG